MKVALLFAVLLLLPSTALHAAEALIVENGMPQAEIVIAEKPQRTVRLAAAELQTYIQKISGARLPIVTEPSVNAVKLFVGRSPHTEKLGITADGLRCGAYRIVSGDDWLVMIGDDTEFTPIEPWARNNADLVSGKLQSAWDQITGEKWGVPNTGMYKHRVKWSGDIGLPDALRTDGKSEPLELWGFDERGAFNAVNGLLQRLGVRWYLPGELGELIPELKTIELPILDEIVRPDFDVRRFNVRLATVTPETAMWAMRLGMRDPYDLQVAHGMATMTSRAEVNAEHPDWYALYGDERRFQPAYTKNQLCYSNQELFQQTVRYVRAQFDHYHYDAVSVMPPDGYGAICQCSLCAGKDQPERGTKGSLSNYVWDFVNRVAQETAKTHPDKRIVCCAYGTYTAVPTNIKKLEPNVQVVIVGGRLPRLTRAEQQAEIRQLRTDWKAKTDRPMMIFENYPITDRGWYLPAFVARTNGASINETKGISAGEDIWLTFGAAFDKKDIGLNHFQVYFTARMYWGGPQQDVAAMLDEYCRLFYGPAGDDMKAFFDYCEVHWQEMETDQAQAEAALALFAKARAKVEVSSVYEKRLLLIDDFLNGLRRKSAQLAQKRGVVPKLRLVGDAKGIVIDGRLDDDYWQNCPAAATGRMRELETGRLPTFGTSFQAGWEGNSLYFAIRCDEHPGEKLNIAATKKEDGALWYGDAVEILLATDSHSYYQIAVSPSGAIVDFDRGAPKSGWSGWESQAEVATHVADDHWTVEIRIPVTDDENDPLNQVIGNKPTQSLPWHINLCRQRIRKNGAEYSALSPTGTNGFHEAMKFAHFYHGRSHQFAADPSVSDFLRVTRDASQQLAERKYAEALAAFVKIADGKVTDVQKSAALEQAVAAARMLQDFKQADDLTARIPIEAVKKVVVMQNLLARRQAAELLVQFGAEDIAAWPFWKQGEGYFARAHAHVIARDADKAAADLKASLEFTSEPRRRADILRLQEALRTERSR